MSDRLNHPTAPEETRYHNYVTSAVPWYIHVIWVLFWVFALSYVFTYVVPTMKVELITPP